MSTKTKNAAKGDAGETNTSDAAIDLSGFDYKNLVGEDFKRYAGIVGDRCFTEFDADTGEEKRGITGTLKLEELHVFCLYRVDVVRKQRFPGMRNSPVDFKGVKVKNDTPVHTTKIPVKNALEHNAQIENAHSIAGHGKYYLLKK